MRSSSRSIRRIIVVLVTWSFFRGMTEAFVFHAGQERLQIVSGCIQCFSGSVLRDRSTPVQ
jgi:hypothetical protein